MNSFVKIWFSTVAKIANEFWWPAWSNFRWRNAIRDNIKISESSKIKTIPDVRRTACKVYNTFTWEADSLDELNDSIIPPPQNYQNYLDGHVRDDCDGFHSTMYHFLYNSGLECYLLSVIALGGGHCVLLFKLDGLWHVCDYTSVYQGFNTPEEAINDYNIKYVEIYEGKSEVYYNGLVEYDYSIGKFKGLSVKNLIKRQS